MRRFSRFGVAALIVVAGGCAATRSTSRPGEDSMYRSAPLPGVEVDVVWEIAVREIEKSGLMINRQATNVHTGEFETHWENELVPFANDGVRRRVIGRVVEIDPASRTCEVRLTFWTQRNTAAKNPSDPGQAEWDNVEADSARSRLLIRRIQHHFVGPDIS